MSPLEMVRRSEFSFIHAIIRTRREVASWTIAGIKPSELKLSLGIIGGDFVGKEKSPRIRGNHRALTTRRWRRPGRQKAPAVGPSRGATNAKNSRCAI